MTARDDLLKLRGVAELMLDVRLAALRKAAVARQETEAHLADLSTPPPPASDVSEVAAERAAVAYQRWADARRRDLNQLLARQTVTWLEARETAGEAFSKTQALDSVAAKLAHKINKSE